MAKRRYMSPLLLTITPGDESTPIIIGGSTGTTGEDNPFKFDLVSFTEEYGEDAQDFIDLIKLSTDDGDLTQMDTDKDHVITFAEFEAWNAIYGLIE